MNRRIVLGIVGLIAIAGLIAADSPPAEFDLTPLSGEAVKGKLLEPSVRLKNEQGIHEFDPDRIRRITFRLRDDDATKDAIELSDHTTHRGLLLQETFGFQIGSETRRIVVADLKEMKVAKKEGSNLWAILFGLLTLTAMEIVLGIDNIIFLAIIAGKLPPEQQPKARRLGLIAALVTRLLLLASLSFLMGLTKPIFTLPNLPLLEDLEAREVSVRDLILLVGGMFLIFKSVREMHDKIERASDGNDNKPAKTATFGIVLIQIAIIDIVFSLDSVITAVGMVEELWVMITAMVVSMLVMMAFAGTISEFVARNPTLKVLALAFLILIGVMLVAEGLGQHIDKGYIYFAMAFAVVVEMVNIKVGRKPHAKEGGTPAPKPEPAPVSPPTSPAIVPPGSGNS
jgi:predicted tellurium resistance membrane protein TerC